ncbi:DUF6221 family protein [Streptomyces sp. NPDC094049]|uniref:DUF6221 family protein n=1 Tax=Streptomyces sp. NPDC094049 TaxID=3154987 RepID=UPI0033337FBD
MDDLIAFLRARLNDDEQTARAVEDGSAPWNGQWTANGPDALRTRNGHVLVYGHWSSDGRNLPMPLKPGLVDHIARHDPARVLAEVEAKRLLLTEYAEVRGNEAADYEWAGGWARGLGQAVAFLALPYADHPDYRPEWAPTT